MIRRRLAIATCAAVVSLGVAAQDTKSDALNLEKKFTAIAERSTVPLPRSPVLVRTSFTERELNAYLSVNGPVIFQAGITRPEVFIDDSGHFRTKAVVDLNAIKASRQRGWLDPLAYLTGAIDLTADGQLATTNGTGTLTIATATLGGVPIPITLLQELVAFYSRTEENPKGFDLQKPFDLPSNIRTIETRRGAATIVQAASKP